MSESFRGLPLRTAAAYLTVKNTTDSMDFTADSVTITEVSVPNERRTRRRGSPGNFTYVMDVNVVVDLDVARNEFLASMNSVYSAWTLR